VIYLVFFSFKGITTLEEEEEDEKAVEPEPVPKGNKHGNSLLA